MNSKRRVDGRTKQLERLCCNVLSVTMYRLRSFKMLIRVDR